MGLVLDHGEKAREVGEAEAADETFDALGREVADGEAQPGEIELDGLEQEPLLGVVERRGAGVVAVDEAALDPGFVLELRGCPGRGPGR